MAEAKPNIWINYTRLSVVRNDNELIGALDQHDINVREIERRGGVVESYSDAGGHRSGRSTKNRPNWRKAYARLQDADVIGIIATFQDRLARDVEDTAALIKLCERLEKHLVIPLDGVDTTRTGWTPDVKLVLHIKAAVAQNYADEGAKKIKRRVVNYHDDKGIPWGRLPFGMKRVGKGYETKVVADNRHMPTVTQVLTWYASGLSYDAVAERANLGGLKFATRGGAPKEFGRESVRTIVGNILTYCGYLPPLGWDAKNDRIKLEGEGSYLQRYLRASGARRVSAIEPVISPDLAELIVERRHKNRLTGRKADTYTFLLSPIAYDSTTGKRLRGETKESGNWYRTRGTGIWLRAEEAEGRLLKRLANVQFPPEAFAIMRAYLEAKTGDQGRKQALATLDEIKTRKSRLVDLRVDGMIERADYDRKLAELEHTERLAQQQMNKTTDVERTIAQIVDLGRSFEDMTPAVKKRNLHRLFERIDFGPDREITALTLRDWARYAFSSMADALLGANNAEGGNQEQHWHPDTTWLLLMTRQTNQIS